MQPTHSHRPPPSCLPGRPIESIDPRPDPAQPSPAAAKHARSLIATGSSSSRPPRRAAAGVAGPAAATAAVRGTGLPYCAQQPPRYVLGDVRSINRRAIRTPPTHPTPHHPINTAPTHPRASTAQSSTTTTAGPSLRDLFFSAVDTELAQRFPDPNQITRVLQFVRSCRAGTIPPEAPTALPFYQPSEEFVPGLTATPWPAPESFPWVKGLEEASPVIRAELERVLAEQRVEDFKGDSNVQKVSEVGGFVGGMGWAGLQAFETGRTRTCTAPRSI